MSIVDPPRSFTRNGLQVNVVVDPERKAPTPKWEENEHPRDREGKFIETFARVKVWGGKLATVLRNVGGGRIQIEYDDHTKATIHRNYLTVVKRPDGTAPTSKRDANVAALPQQPAAADAPEVPKPTTPPDIDMGDVHEGLDHFLRKLDSDLAGRVESASNDYQAAVGNDIPDDEADERARLIDALDEVDQKYGDDRRVSMMSRALRDEAVKEPDGSPEIARQQANDEPVTVRPAGTPDAGFPITPPPAAEKPKPLSPQERRDLARSFNPGDPVEFWRNGVRQPGDEYVVSRLARNDYVRIHDRGTNTYVDADPSELRRKPDAAPAEKPQTESIAAREVNKGDVLHTRLGRVTVVEQPKRQPNQSYALVLDRGNGKPPVKLTMGSRDRVDRETSPAATPEPTAAPAPPTPPQSGPVGAPNALPIRPDVPVTDTPSAPDADKPGEAPATRKYRTTKLGAREAAYAAEVQDTDGYQSGLSVNGQIVTVTDPESALWSLAGIRDIHSDNLSESARDYLDAAERRNARASATALTNLMNAIRRDYGITGDGKPSPKIADDQPAADAPNVPDVPDVPDAPDFTDLGRQAYRAGAGPKMREFAPARDAWPSVARADQSQASDDYHAGWEAERRETNPAEAIRAEIASAQATIDGLTHELSTTTHARRKTSLQEQLTAAQARHDRLSADLAKLESGGDESDSEAAAEPSVPAVPAAPQPPVKPERRQLDGFSAAESARIHNAVEDHATLYAGRPGANANRDDVARYVSEGHLNDLVADHGLPKVWRAARSVIDDDPTVMARSREDLDRVKGERETKLDELNRAAGAAAQAGNWDEALRGLDEMETIDPMFRPGGLAIDDLRGRLTRMRGAEPQHQDAPGNAPDVTPDTAPDAAAPEATGGAGPVAAQDLQVGDVIDYGGRQYTITTSEPDNMGRNDWHFEATDNENGRRLSRRVSRQDSWQRVSSNGAPDQQNDAETPNAPSAPETPDATPQADVPAASQRLTYQVGGREREYPEVNGQAQELDGGSLAVQADRGWNVYQPIDASEVEGGLDTRGNMVYQHEGSLYVDRGHRATTVEEASRLYGRPAKPAAERRFATVDAVRDWLGKYGATPKNVREDPERRAKAQALNQRIAKDPMLTLSDSGNLMVHRNPVPRGNREWRISASVNGMWLGNDVGQFRTREEALEAANLYEKHVDKDGNPFPWDSDDVAAQVSKWKDANGKKIGPLIKGDRKTVPSRRLLNSDFEDAWWTDGSSDRAPEPQRTPTPPPTPEPQGDRTGNEYASEAYQANQRGDQAAALAALDNAQRVDPGHADRWNRLRREVRGLPAVPRDTPLDNNGDVVSEPNAPEANAPEAPASDQDWEEIGRQAHRNGDQAAPALNAQVQAALEGRPVGDPESTRIMREFSRGWDAENAPANINLPDAAATHPGADAADVDVPAVPPADAEPSAPAAPRAESDGGRWNIAPVETTGDEETDKRALAANLRAAARSATSAEDRAALNWAARQLDPPKPRPRPATDGSAPAPRRRAASPRTQARAQADSDVATARRARKPPVSPEARMAALADLADELDRLGLGSVAVTPSDDGSDGGQTGGRKSLVTVLRQYVAEYKQRRAEMASGGAGGDSGATGQGGTDGSDSDSGGAALQEVPAADVPGSGGPGGVLPESGGGSAGADRRPDGSVLDGGDSSAGRDVRAEGGEAPERPAAGGGTGNAGDRAAGSGDGGDRGPGAGDRVPAEPGPADTTGAGDAGGPAVGGGDDGVPGRDRGVERAEDEPAAAEPVRSDDAGEPADGVTEADQPTPEPSAVPTAISDGENFRPTGAADFAPAGKTAKLNANIQALQTLRTLQREKRPATRDEQALLARWAGWGGLPEVFDPKRAEYATQREELRGLLSEKEWNEAKRNTLNAHYTDARVVQSVWDAVGQLGFNGGRVLEPGSGSGTFIGFAPDNAQMVGVELDSTTAALSQYLYPNANIRNESFARTNLPDGSFDMTIGNVPFGKFALSDRRHNADNESIHNHFILKSMDLTRPGGLVAVLTSRYTLDSQDSKARRKMADKADLVGAVRLPTGSHQRVSGTDVIEDLLIFRVRGDGETPQTDQSWVTSSKKDVNGFQIAVNNYWAEHPENVLGEMSADKGQYGTGDLRVVGDRDMTDLPAVLSGIVESAHDEGLVATASSGDRPELVDADESRHDGHIRQEEDGSFTQAVNGASVPFDVPASQREELGSLVELRDTLGRLLDAESANRANTPEITALRQRLNDQYDAYVAKNGPINRFKLGKTGNRIRPGQGNFRRDPMSAVVRALETYDPTTGTATKASIFTKRAVAPRELRTSTDSPADAISLSMDAYGEVNLPAIADMLGVDEATARERLGTLVFEAPPTFAPADTEFRLRDDEAAGIDPTGDLLAAQGIDKPTFSLPEIDEDAIGTPGPLEPSAAYLSGNVRKKLAVAQAAAALDPRFQVNVDALQAVIPQDLTPQEIDGRLGAAWIDPGTVQDFLRELVDDRYGYTKVVNHGGSIWTVEGPSYGNLSMEVWGTDDRSASQLVQSLLEQRPIKVTRSVDGPDGKKKNVQDLEATLAAQAKAEAIQERFGEWLWENPDRARKLQRRYNDQFNAIVLRSYDGSARQFEGMADAWEPREHQRNAVERIVNEPTALLGHVVGAGKTAEMVMGTAELKRLGMARKPAIVVPNHMLEQFTREYLEVYPQARLLSAGSADLQGDSRREFVGRAATGDWDAVILTQGAFESIPMSVEQQEAYIDREMTTMRQQLAIAQAAAFDERGTGSKAQEKTVKKMEAALLRAEEALKKKLDKQKDVGVSFEQTGIDYLMVDEAHGYSNLRVLSNIQGAGNVGSDRATDLHMKLEYLRETSKSGRVATFATGTPIRNTVTQAYVMQKFLRPDLLEEAGIHSFDQWAATFGQTVDEMELKPEGTGFRQTTRFAKFRNVPELLKQFHTFADIKLAEDLALPTPNLEGGKAQTVLVPSSEQLSDYIQELGARAEKVRNGQVEPEEDNMLKISGDGRKAALSMQLVGGDHEPGKIEAAADKIANIWTQNKDKVYTDPKTGEDDPIPGAMQIVFLDIGTPTGTGWNGYDTLKSELVKRGLDPSSVRYIHEAKNDAQKAELFAAARSGRISVLIGSSEKMGVGTNIQKRAVHLHHLDAPWRPADVEQRDGRIMRQGNWNADIGISRYVTEGSFDAYMWQTLERKAKFINQIMKGSLDVREIEDIGDTAMSYAEIKALATGNPDILELAKSDTAMQKLDRLERTHNRVQANLKSDIQTSTANAQVWESYAAMYDAALSKRIDTRGDAFTMTMNGRQRTKRQDAAEAFRAQIMQAIARDRWHEMGPQDLGTIGGFTVTGEVGPAPGGKRRITVRFDGIPGDLFTLTMDDLTPKVDPKTGQEAPFGFGLVTRLESALESFEAKRDRLLQSAAEARVEVRRMEQRIGQEFPKGAELAALRLKVQRLRLKIDRDAKRADGEDIPFDPLIDSDQYDSAILSTAEDADVPPEDFGATTGADLRRAAEARADAEKTLAIVNGRVIVRLTTRKVAA